MESIAFSNIGEKTDMVLQENVESLDDILRSKVEDKSNSNSEEREDDTLSMEGFLAAPLAMLSTISTISTKHQRGVQPQEQKNQNGMGNFRNENLLSLKFNNSKSILNIGEGKALARGESASVKNNSTPLDVIRQKLISSEDISTDGEDSLLPSLKKDNISTLKSADGGALSMTMLSTSTLSSSSVIDTKMNASLLHSSTLEAKLQAAVENRKMLDTSSMDSNSLTYRFQRWGGEYSVNIKLKVAQ
ncbi:type III secretion system needle length determinant, SpaN/EivJ family (plasmid) [Providencia alcalifaciens]|nr:type III secretion system needle length determinant, SpaN/EivJ family [Providencia alcalifaciens]